MLLLLLSIGPGVSIAHSQTHNLHIESVFNGYVTGPGIDCGAGRTDCDEPFLPADVVQLQAVPLAGYSFLGWEGNVCIGVARARVIQVDYPSTTVLSLAATPSTGYEFKGWGGACTGHAATTQVSVTHDRKCFAAFYPTGGAPRDAAIWQVEFQRSGAPPVRHNSRPGCAPDTCDERRPRLAHRRCR
jgi:uncharacterized repeat protein (TIGR02543 family)